MIVERPALERRVTASLEAGRIPVVLGNCGAGRSSLLLRLENTLGRSHAQYLDLAAAASTPERCLRAIATASHLDAARAIESAAASPRAAFDGLLGYFGAGWTSSPGTLTFLIDEFLDIRTFESFPGLRHVQRELVDHLAHSPARYVLTSRFTSRVHRLLRDASSRFEVIHLPALEVAEVDAMALRFDGGRRDWAAAVAPTVTALSGGRPAAANVLLGWLASSGPSSDPVAGLAALFSPDGQLTARYRECYEFRLHRARGYGALKAILQVLSEEEPLTLTQIAQRLDRTAGSTKDYLSWLQDVDMLTCQRKRYTFADPLLRLWVRIYSHPEPPTEERLAREVQSYAMTRLQTIDTPPPPERARAAGSSRAVAPAGSGIIEID